ncbi:MAG: hypothetical protein H7066_07500, partial [Cytophagaceae bacterium]|nr:hypothetical protein [Gemmatimonadaceae bacterium]
MSRLRRGVRLLLWFSMFVAPLAVCGQERPAGSAGSPAPLYRTGKYAEAISAAEARLATDANDVTAAITLVRALRDVG